MATNSVTAPFFSFLDSAGKPLEAGFIYIGQPGLEARSSPKASFFDLALSIPTGTSTGAAVRTMGGYPVQNGSAALIYVDGDYSMTVTDRNGVLVFSRLNRAIQVGIETTSSGLFGDGNLAGVGIGFGAEPTTGLIRSAASQMRGVVSGVPIWQASASGFSLFSPLPISSGGTGSSSAATARTNLGAGATGSTLFTAVDAVTARSIMGASLTGAQLFTAANAAAALAITNGQPIADNTRLQFLYVGPSTPLVLPPGFTWGYWWMGQLLSGSGSLQFGGAGAAAGGSTLSVGAAGSQFFGFAWRTTL